MVFRFETNLSYKQGAMIFKRKHPGLVLSPDPSNILDYLEILGGV